MFINNFDPVAIEVFSLEIRWYSLAYIVGILLGWYLAKKIFINNDIKDKFDEYITYVIIGLILGGRLGYVLFYNFDYYLNNFFDIFKIWQGGMSFHGALIGIIFATYLFSKKAKVNSFFFLDIIASVAPIGIFLGRIANFINGELYGKQTDLFWSVVFPQIDKLPRHPSQIYEAILEGVFLFFILIGLIFRKNIKTGTVSALFMILYGLFRIISEQFREPDIQVGYLFNLFSMGSILSFFMVLIGLLILKKTKDNGFA